MSFASNRIVCGRPLWTYESKCIKWVKRGGDNIKLLPYFAAPLENNNNSDCFQQQFYQHKQHHFEAFIRSEVEHILVMRSGAIKQHSLKHWINSLLHFTWKWMHEWIIWSAFDIAVPITLLFFWNYNFHKLFKIFHMIIKYCCNIKSLCETWDIEFLFTKTARKLSLNDLERRIINKKFYSLFLHFPLLSILQVIKIPENILFVCFSSRIFIALLVVSQSKRIRNYGCWRSLCNRQLLI